MTSFLCSPLVRVDTTKLDQLLLDVLLALSGEEQSDGWYIDTQCLRDIEMACSYLTERELLNTRDGRMYLVKSTKKGDEIRLCSGCNTMKKQCVAMGIQGSSGIDYLCVRCRTPKKEEVDE